MIRIRNAVSNAMATLADRSNPEPQSESAPGKGPDFICFGMQKAGTRWLYDQMCARKDIWMPPIKEMNFFKGPPLRPKNAETIEKGTTQKPHSIISDDRDLYFIREFADVEKHLGDTEWYMRLFDYKDTKLSGDVSPNYSRLEPRKISMLSRAMPEARFVLLVREPVSRLWSYLRMRVRQKSLTEADIVDWPNVERVLRSPSVARNSFPSKVWQDWSHIVPAERIRFWFFDDICTQPSVVVNEVCEFLSTAPGPGSIPASYNRNVGTAKVAMPAAIQRNLLKYFEQEHDNCARLFGGHATRWREQAAALQS